MDAYSLLLSTLVVDSAILLVAILILLRICVGSRLRFTVIIGVLVVISSIISVICDALLLMLERKMPQ